MKHSGNNDKTSCCTVECENWWSIRQNIIWKLHESCESLPLDIWQLFLIFQTFEDAMCGIEAIIGAHGSFYVSNVVLISASALKKRLFLISHPIWAYNHLNPKPFWKYTSLQWKNKVDKWNTQFLEPALTRHDMNRGRRLMRKLTEITTDEQRIALLQDDRILETDIP